MFVGKLNTKFVHKIPLGRILTLTLTPTLAQNDSPKRNGHYNIALNLTNFVFSLPFAVFYSVGMYR